MSRVRVVLDFELTPEQVAVLEEAGVPTSLATLLEREFLAFLRARDPRLRYSGRGARLNDYDIRVEVSG